MFGPKIEVGVNSMEKVQEEVGSSLIMFGTSNSSSSRARLNPC